MFDLNKSIISLNCSNIINNLQYEYNDLKGNTVLKSNPPLGGLLCPFTKEDIKSGKQGHAPRPNYDTYKPGSYHDFDVGGDKPPVYIGNNNEKKK